MSHGPRERGRWPGPCPVSSLALLADTACIRRAAEDCRRGNGLRLRFSIPCDMRASPGRLVRRQRADRTMPEGRPEPDTGPEPASCRIMAACGLADFSSRSTSWYRAPGRRAAARRKTTQHQPMSPHPSWVNSKAGWHKVCGWPAPPDRSPILRKPVAGPSCGRELKSRWLLVAQR